MPLEKEDQVTLKMLQNLIDNIEAGNLTTLKRSGGMIDNDEGIVELRLVLQGEPKINP